MKTPTSGGQGFISPDLNTNGVIKSGYTVTLAPASTAIAVGTSGDLQRAGGQPSSAYFAKADPVTLNGTGTRYFATDTRGTIFQDTAATIANPIVVAGTVKPVQ